MKKWLTCVILLLFPIQVYAHPPIPAESPQTEKVAIVTVSQPLTQNDIHQMLQPYPDLRLRYIYQHALQGFSVKGTVKSLKKLGKSNQVNLVSPVKTYKTQQEENIKIIGGDVVRGLFDSSNQRLTGKGIKVGVIDTGIDYRHPDLRRSYKGGHDFVDEDEDPMESESTNGPLTLHGTHVAGIIAANGRINGVAPEAEVIAYRALGPGGSGTTEQVLAAIEKAIEDKVDILNLSLGNSINGPDLPISLALNKAAEKGIVPVTSSGNAGPNMWTVGSPGTAAKAISVGASTPPQQIPYLQIEGQKEKVRLEPMEGSAKWQVDRSHPLVFGKLGRPEDLENVKGKIALIERGELTFTEKAKNAQKAGAVAIIIYNNTDGQFIGNLDEKLDIPVASISKKAGHKLKQSRSAYTSIHIIEEKDILADFSSRGPVTATWEVKPDVVAPGVAITSTVPGGYLALQGTSMASPHVAGACALIKQAHPDWSPEQIKAALMNTAKPLTNRKGTTYRTFEQGAGRIQMEEAIHTESLVMPASLKFGQFKRVEQPHKHSQFITIENVSTKTQSYAFQIPYAEKGIQWQMPLTFSLKPKEKKQVEIQMTVNPKELKKKIYDGYLSLQAGSQNIHLPYIYVVEEPDYPRIMGFDFGLGDEEETFRYEVYLPGGAEEFGIALFEPDSYRFVAFLDTKRDVGKGMLEEVIKKEQLPDTGLYLAQIFAKKDGQEDMIETSIFIEKDAEK